MEFLWALSAAVLILADQGEVEQAQQVHNLLSQYGHVTQSRWFADVIGRPLASVADALPPTIVPQAAEQGRPQDLRASLMALQRELDAKKTGRTFA
jgi:hypothetical protein